MIQESSTFQRWFSTNAPAAWITAIIAIISCILVIRSKNKPKRLVVRELRNSSLVRIWPSVRSKIRMTFEGQNIAALAQIELEIFNDGSDVIRRPTFRIEVPVESRILDVQIGPEDTDAQTVIEENKAAVTLPYLNPMAQHQQIVKLSILVDGASEDVQVRGMGESWSVLHLPRPTQRSLLVQVLVAMLFLIAIFVGNFFYSKYLERRIGIPNTEISWRAFIAYLPIILPILGLLIWLGLFVKKFFSLLRELIY